MDSNQKHQFIPGFEPDNHKEGAAWALMLWERNILLKEKEDVLVIPDKSELDLAFPEYKDYDYMGSFTGHNCYCIRVKGIESLPQGFRWCELREVTELTGDNELFILAGAANHLLHWSSMNQFCGRCGQPTVKKVDERAKICPSCGNIVYPRISPATITAVFDGDKILLAHNKNFKKNLYSLIAGFVEIGETLEQCVEREIQEEVGIKVKNVRYFSSQPWPFPDSLMVAFTAEYESGQIQVDGSEILDAQWFTKDSLPVIPSTDSVAGKMIRWYRDQRMKDSDR